MSKAQTLEPIRGLVDSHCHLDYPELSEDLKGVVSRANEAGIEWMTTICTRLDNFPQVLDVARKR
jgi:TatD DNase family protein